MLLGLLRRRFGILHFKNKFGTKEDGSFRCQVFNGIMRKILLKE